MEEEEEKEAERYLRGNCGRCRKRKQMFVQTELAAASLSHNRLAHDTTAPGLSRAKRNHLFHGEDPVLTCLEHKRDATVADQT